MGPLRQDDSAIRAGEDDRAGVSEATVARLPRYLHVAFGEVAGGAESISSERLAARSGVNAATVRRDLSRLKIHGVRGIGYEARYLASELSRALGTSEEWPVLVVGVGNFGRALVNHRRLPERGFPIRAVLDIDERIVGSTVGDLQVEHLDQLESIVVERGIGLGVIATPPGAAQGVADSLVAAGLRSILNLTSTPLEVGTDVEVRRVDLATEMQILSFRDRRRKNRPGVVG